VRKRIEKLLHIRTITQYSKIL